MSFDTAFELKSFLSTVILEPYKVSRPRKESIKDAMELTEFISDNINYSNLNKNARVVSNNMKAPKNIINHPDRITDQFIQNQINQGLLEVNSKRLYAMTYKLNKDDLDITIDEGEKMAQEVLSKYPTFQGIAAVTEGSDSIIINMIFNNYSNDGERMTKCYRPYYMSNSYNNMKRKKSK